HLPFSSSRSSVQTKEMMDWDNKQQLNGGGIYVKVMTDEQLKTLRKNSVLLTSTTLF
ncbi:unnamed protein product, partial [Eruca vesicaria subsp. sativa]|nr:unnamed protein product [Eruca vesicaria subsp. sativa]